MILPRANFPPATCSSPSSRATKEPGGSSLLKRQSLNRTALTVVAKKRFVLSLPMALNLSHARSEVDGELRASFERCCHRAAFFGLLMFFSERSQAYPIACGPCLAALGDWADWYGWLDCVEHTKLGPYQSKCPGVRIAFTADPHPGRAQVECCADRAFSVPLWVS